MIALFEGFQKRLGSIISGDWRHPDRRPLWEFTSERTKAVEIKAVEEARRHGHALIGTEHLLLGILAEDSGQAVASLRRNNVTLLEVRSILELLNGVGPDDPKRSKWHVTPNHSAALFAAGERSRELASPVVEPEHLLYGILQYENSKAARILRYLGVSTPELLAELRE